MCSLQIKRKIFNVRSETDRKAVRTDTNPIVVSLAEVCTLWELSGFCATWSWCIYDIQYVLSLPVKRRPRTTYLHPALAACLVLPHPSIFLQLSTFVFQISFPCVVRSFPGGVQYTVMLVWRCCHHCYTGCNFGLKSGGTNSEGERGALGSRGEREKNGEAVSLPHRTLGLHGRASLALPTGSGAENGFVII